MAWFNKGVALAKLGKYEEAIECYDKVIELNPNYAPAWYNKGVALAKLGRYEEAIECYKKAVELNPDYVDAWFNMGVAYAKLGKYEEAIKCYDKVLELNPKDYYAWNNKGVALAKLGKYEEAIECYKKAIELNPNYADAWYNLGLALTKLGKYEEAIKCFDKVLQLKPEYKSAKESKELIEKKINGSKERPKKPATIELSIDKYNFKVNRWTKLELEVKNNSDEKEFENIIVKINCEEFKGKKLPKIKKLKPSESKKYIIYIKPLDLGEVPLDFYVEYESNGIVKNKLISFEVNVEE